MMGTLMLTAFVLTCAAACACLAVAFWPDE